MIILGVLLYLQYYPSLLTSVVGLDILLVTQPIPFTLSVIVPWSGYQATTW